MATSEAPRLGVSSIMYQSYSRNKQLFREYLSFTPVSNAASSSTPSQQLSELIGGGVAGNRFQLSLSEMEAFSEGISAKIMKDPAAYLPAFDEALLEAVLNTQPDYLSSTHAPRVTLTGVVGVNHVTPRGLHALMIGQLACVEGIVCRASLTKPRARLSVFYNTGSGDMRVKEHKDPASLHTDLSVYAGTVPKQDENGNPYVTEYGFSLYRDYQKITIAEMPEMTPTGQLPRSVDVLLAEDMVDSAKPGDRVSVVGMYRGLASASGGVTGGMFGFVVIACGLSKLTQTKETSLTANDIKQIKQIAQRPDTFELLSSSFAPSISGRSMEKQGLLLQQFGGAEKCLPNGTHLRGDINVLLIGDPSAGKSQLLRFCMNMSPLAISTTGRGSSGVGLTAAITIDRDSNERTLEAGAFVLADRGLICIDEFDKMSTADRVAIHEVMEQQTVTIAKAGVHTSLNARCSVLAAANPIYGNFDDTLDLNKNVNLPDSLLSRFDLVYVVRDLMGEQEDRRISTQVLKQGRSAKTLNIRSQHGSQLEPRAAASAVAGEDAGAVFRKDANLVTVSFLKKYIAYCKSKPHPVLSEAAVETISDIYVSLREASLTGGLSVTTRQLESLIRLATAHAKLKLKTVIDDEDVTVARNMMHASRGEVLHVVEEDNDGEDAMQIEQDGISAVPQRRDARRSSARKRAPSVGAEDVEDAENRQRQRTEEIAAARVVEAAQRAVVVELSAERLEQLKETISEAFGDRFTTFMELEDLRQDVQTISAAAGAVFSIEEINKGLQVLQDLSRVYVASEVVYLIS